jgi:hypothetical protein
MANSSILGGEHAPVHPSGTDVDALGPSDSSDSGSDVQTDLDRSALPDEGSEGSLSISHGSNSDAAGTGERASSDNPAGREDADILPDRIGIVPPGFDRDPPDDADAAAVDELAVTDDREDEDEAEGGPGDEEA